MQTLTELEDAVQALAEENIKKKPRHREQIKENVKDGAHKLAFFRRCMSPSASSG